MKVTNRIKNRQQNSFKKRFLSTNSFLWIIIILACAHFFFSNPRLRYRVGIDFKSFYYATKVAREGGDIYDAHRLNALARIDKVRGYVYPYLYPPTFAALMYFMGFLPIREAAYFWNILNIILCALAFFFSIKIILEYLTKEPAVNNKKKFLVLMAAVSFAIFLFYALPFRRHFSLLGQSNIIVLTFIVLSFYFLFNRSKYYLSGFLMSIAFCIKTTPIVLMLILLPKGRAKSVMGFLSGSVILLVTSLFLIGSKAWIGFFNFLPYMRYGQTPPGLFSPKDACNFSIAGFFSRLFTNTRFVSILTILTIAILAVIAYHIYNKRKPHHLLMILPLSCFMMLASPFAYFHHTIYLLPGLLVTLSWIFIKVFGVLKYIYLGLFLSIVAMLEIYYPHIYKAKHISGALITSLNFYFLFVLFLVSLMTLPNMKESAAR